MIVKRYTMPREILDANTQKQIDLVSNIYLENNADGLIPTSPENIRVLYQIWDQPLLLELYALLRIAMDRIDKYLLSGL